MRRAATPRGVRRISGISIEFSKQTALPALLSAFPAMSYYNLRGLDVRLESRRQYRIRYKAVWGTSREPILSPHVPNLRTIRGEARSGKAAILSSCSQLALLCLVHRSNISCATAVCGALRCRCVCVYLHVTSNTLKDCDALVTAPIR